MMMDYLGTGMIVAMSESAVHFVELTKDIRMLSKQVFFMRRHYMPANRERMERVGLIAWTRSLSVVEKSDALWRRASPALKSRLDGFVSHYTTIRMLDDGSNVVISLTVNSIFDQLWSEEQ